MQERQLPASYHARMALQKFTITGYSTALFSTWLFIEELRLLFDAGDGVSAGLTQKSRKIRNVMISHADRDHLAGLLQLLQLNGRDGLPRVHFPADCGSFPALADFCSKFDQGTSGKVCWVEAGSGARIPIGSDYFVCPFHNNHVSVADGVTKSLSFKVERETRKLKDEFKDASSETLKTLREEQGNDHITRPSTSVELGYSADCQVKESDADIWAGTKILMHESTFLSPQEANDVQRHRHSILPDVLTMARDAKPEALILTHFSMRYNFDQIRKALCHHARELKLAFPVFVIPPGTIVRDVLRTEPVWNGS